MHQTAGLIGSKAYYRRNNFRELIFANEASGSPISLSYLAEKVFPIFPLSMQISNQFIRHY